LEFDKYYHPSSKQSVYPSVASESFPCKDKISLAVWNISKSMKDFVILVFVNLITVVYIVVVIIIKGSSNEGEIDEHGF
jgi:hypothetical protein